jgi:hypothetical protein
VRAIILTRLHCVDLFYLIRKVRGGESYIADQISTQMLSSPRCSLFHKRRPRHRTASLGTESSADGACFDHSCRAAHSRLWADQSLFWHTYMDQRVKIGVRVEEGWTHGTAVPHDATTSTSFQSGDRCGSEAVRAIFMQMIVRQRRNVRLDGKQFVA